MSIKILVVLGERSQPRYSARAFDPPVSRNVNGLACRSASNSHAEQHDSLIWPQAGSSFAGSAWPAAVDEATAGTKPPAGRASSRYRRCQVKTEGPRAAHDDLPTSWACVTRVRLSFEWSQLRWRQVLADRSAAADDTPGIASCRSPIRCLDRPRKSEFPMSEVAERNVDASGPAIRRARFRPTARGSPRSGRYCRRFGFSRSARTGNSPAGREAGGNSKDSISRLRQGRMAKPLSVPRSALRATRAIARFAPAPSPARSFPAAGTALGPRPSAGR